MMDAQELISIAEAVAKLLWGEPNKKLSSRKELRWGNHGSRSLNLEKGTWYDNEVKEGGGVLDLVNREKSLKGKEAVNWLREQGFEVGGDDRPQRQPHGGREARAGAEPRRDQGRQPEASSGASGDGPPLGKPVATYDYVDENGVLLFQVCRFEPKTFRQRRPDPNERGGWSYKVQGIRQVPYRLPELLEAIAQELTIFAVEGEKDADNLWAMGVPATCNAGGAGKWPEELSAFFRGVDVVILPDNDPQTFDKVNGVLKFHPDGRPMHAGRDHADLVGRRLTGVAASVRVLELPNLPMKGDVTDWIEAGGAAEPLYDLVQAQSKPWREPTVYRSRFQAVPWMDLEKPGPEHEWLMKGVLTRGERSMLAGPSQSGKSFLALDFALTIARGMPYRCFAKATQGWKMMELRTLPGGVVYQAGEGARGLKKRLRAYRKHHGLKSEDLPFVLLPSPVDLHANDDHTDQLIDEIKHWSSTFKVRLELVVIDTFSAATPGANENASEDMSRALARCARIAEATGAHVMIVHHMNADGNKPRGHTSIYANLDNVVVCRKIEGMRDERGRQLREVILSKQKDGEDGLEIRFVLRSEEIGVDVDGDPVTSCVVVPPALDARGMDAATDPRSVPVKLTAQLDVFLRAVHRAIDEFGEAPPLHLQLPKSLRVVRGERVREVFERMSFENADESDENKRRERIKKAMQRHGTELIAKGIINRENPFIWLTGRKVRGFRLNTPPAPDDATKPADNVVSLDEARLSRDPLNDTDDNWPVG